MVGDITPISSRTRPNKINAVHRPPLAGTPSTNYVSHRFRRRRRTAGYGRFCCKSILELGRARARRTRFLPKLLSRMGIPARPLSAEHGSISSAIYPTTERILQQNRHESVGISEPGPLQGGTAVARIDADRGGDSSALDAKRSWHTGSLATQHNPRWTIVSRSFGTSW